MGLSKLLEISIQRHKVSSHPFPPPSLYYVYIKTSFVNKQTDTNVLNQYEISSPLNPFPFAVGVDSWLRSSLWDKVSYSQLRQRAPYTMFFFEYSLWSISLNGWGGGGGGGGNVGKKGV
jgi:hypothetical protein